MSPIPSKHPDRPSEQAPQPMGPAPDLQLMGIPVDPLGLPDRPAATARPVHNGQRSSKVRWLGLIAFAVAVAGIALVLWLASS